MQWLKQMFDPESLGLGAPLFLASTFAASVVLALTCRRAQTSYWRLPALVLAILVGVLVFALLPFALFETPPHLRVQDVVSGGLVLLILPISLFLFWFPLGVTYVVCAKWRASPAMLPVFALSAWGVGTLLYLVIAALVRVGVDGPFLIVGTAAGVLALAFLWQRAKTWRSRLVALLLAIVAASGIAVLLRFFVAIVRRFSF